MSIRTLRSACLALSLVAGSPCVDAQERDAIQPGGSTGETSSGNANGRLHVDDRIRDIVDHPAFQGFGRLILPWDDRAYDGDMRLRDIGALLPYHSRVDPVVAVSALNRMIDDAGNGKTIFYDFYTAEQKQEQPARAHTGLFFFRGKPGAPFAVIAPGGGFSYVASVHEGFPYAAEISRQGYNAFVLKYRAGQGGAVATQDLAAAICYIVDRAQTLGVSARDYSVWGSSAGARMAATIGTHGVAQYGGKAAPKPSAVVMAYTAHSDYSSNDPPTFAIVGEADEIAPPSTMEQRVSALRNAGVDVEYRKFKGLGHGFGLGTATSAERWTVDAVRFWERSIKTTERQ
jgi:acetyl esterase/lipase